MSTETSKLPPGVPVDRRRMVRLPVARSLVAHVVEVGQSVTLQDISAGGFSAMAAVKLTLGAAYEFRFVLTARNVAVHARLAYAMRISGQHHSVHLMGFEFVETERDEAAIAALIAQATTD
jgi:hypothetical protein